MRIISGGGLVQAVADICTPSLHPQPYAKFNLEFFFLNIILTACDDRDPIIVIES